MLAGEAIARRDFEARDLAEAVERLLERRVPIAVVAGEDWNMKVTEPIDVYLADKLFQLTSNDAPAPSTEEEYRAALAGPGETALFVGTRGARLSAPQVRKRLAQRALQAGLPTHVHPHMLRHSFASHILQSSGDLRAVQELLGHAHITTTQIYTKLDFQHLAKVYDAAHPRAQRKGSGSGQ